MTKEEREKAIDLLDNLLGMVEDNQNNDYDKALRMGIESLREEPCEDCISREEIISKISEYADVANGGYFSDSVEDAIMVCVGIADELPSVVPVQKKGKWTNGNPICPCCGEDKFKDLDADIWADWQPKYCPNCGAEMEREQLLSYADQDTMQPAT